MLHKSYMKSMYGKCTVCKIFVFSIRDHAEYYEGKKQDLFRPRKHKEGEWNGPKNQREELHFLENINARGSTLSKKSTTLIFKVLILMM